MTYLISPLVLTLCFKAPQTFSELSLAIFAFLALSNAVRLSIKVVLVVGDDLPGGL